MQLLTAHLRHRFFIEIHDFLLESGPFELRHLLLLPRILPALSLITLFLLLRVYIITSIDIVFTLTTSLFDDFLVIWF